MPSKPLSSRKSSSATPRQICADEVEQVSRAIEDRESKYKIIVAIFALEASSAVIAESFRPRLWDFWRWGKSRKVIPTTCVRLPEAINAACNQSSRRRNDLCLLFSPYITNTSFHIPSRFRNLTIKHCRTRRHASHLIIQDTSTFCGIELPQWEGRGKKYRRHVVEFKGHVYLGLDLGKCDGQVNLDSISNESWGCLRDNMDSLSGTSEEKGDTWWERWKGVVASLLGILAGTMKFKAGIKVSSGGLYATHWLGAKLFAGYISGSATMSIAAPVAACAFGTAAAVYFIPWGSLISWIKRAVSKIWSLLGSVWNWLKERFSTFSTAAEDLPPPYRPMEFAS